MTGFMVYKGIMVKNYCFQEEKKSRGIRQFLPLQECENIWSGQDLTSSDSFPILQLSKLWAADWAVAGLVLRSGKSDSTESTTPRWTRIDLPDLLRAYLIFLTYSSLFCKVEEITLGSQRCSYMLNKMQCPLHRRCSMHFCLLYISQWYHLSFSLLEEGISV